jgi:hypothetical protein
MHPAENSEGFAEPAATVQERGLIRINGRSGSNG